MKQWIREEALEDTQATIFRESGFGFTGPSELESIARSAQYSRVVRKKLGNFY